MTPARLEIAPLKLCPWSRTNNRYTNLLFRSGLFCVLYRPLYDIRERSDPVREAQAAGRTQGLDRQHKPL